MSDVTAPSQRSAPSTIRKRRSPAWLIPASVAAASLIVILLLVLAQ